MKKIILLMFILFWKFTDGQPNIQWKKCYGGSADEAANSVRQTSDLGFIVAGYSGSIDGDVTGNHGSWDYWILKIDSAGIIQWQKSYGGTGDDQATSVQQTNDGGYIIAGFSNSNDGDVTGNHGNYDYWVVKLNSSGIIQWQKTLGGAGEDKAYSVCQTSDGGYAVAGYLTNNADYFIVKLDAGGTTQWQQTLGGTGVDIATSIQQTTDGGYIIGGYSNSTDGNVTGMHGTSGASDYWIVKADGSGNIQWQKALGGNGQEQAYSASQTSDGGYIIGGISYSNNGDVTGHHGNSSYDDFWIVKLNTSGTIQWQKSFGGTNYDEATSVQQTSDGGFIIGGWSGSFDGDVSGNNGNKDYWIFKLDNIGSIQWQKNLGGSDIEEAFAIQQINGGGFIVGGFTGTNNDGDVTGFHGFYDFWIVKLLPYSVGIEEYFSSDAIVLAPNPTSDILLLKTIPEIGIIHLEITNPFGKKIYSQKLFSAQTEINLSNQHKGIYFITVTDEAGNKAVKKIVKM